jgi:formate dehydrogenase iron-sulfur subunit
MNAIRVYVPRDSAALAVGSDEVADAIVAQAASRGASVELIRNGSRGLFWLEVLVEVATPAGRVAYGPVSVDDVASLFDTGFLSGGAHALSHGLTEQIDYLARQQRLLSARFGVTDPLSLADYAAHGGWTGLQAALQLAPGLRGRGGAAFPAGIKWRTVAQARSQDPVAQKYVVCNADEGDSGTFADRMVLEDDPYMLIEGMAIAALSSGATQGYVYIRSEYPVAFEVFGEAIRRATAAGFIGANVLGSGKAFHLEARMKKPRCSSRWKASAASCAPSRRFPR